MAGQSMARPFLFADLHDLVGYLLLSHVFLFLYVVVYIVIVASTCLKQKFIESIS